MRAAGSAVLLLLVACDPVTGTSPDAAVDRTPDASSDLPTCQQYCETIQPACADVPQYPNVTACEAYCETFGKIPIGQISDQAGNTVGCRTYHATVASTISPDVHCPHAGPTGGDVCGSWCDNYCHLAMLNCTGTAALYGSVADCFNACGAIPADGQPGDEGGNTIQCRIHYLGLAGTEPPGSQTQFCPAGRVNDDTHCI